MQKKKVIVLLTAAGILGASAIVGASGLTQKVTGLLRSDVQVSVNGAAYSSLKPVYIDGKAYLPARDSAAAMGYDLYWNAQTNQMSLKEKEQSGAVEEKPIVSSGIVVNAHAEGDLTSLEVLGKGANNSLNWVIAKADKDTIVVDENGAVKSAKDIKPGTRVTVEYGPIMTMSFPGQSHAIKVTVGTERLVREDKVGAVTKTDGGWQVQLGEGKDDAAASNLVLNVSDSTLITSPTGEQLKVEDLKAGAKVRAYFGPATTRSIPAQSAADTIVVLPQEAP